MYYLLENMRKDIYTSKEQIMQWIEEGHPKAYMCRQLKCRPQTLDSALKSWGVSYKGNSSIRGVDTNYAPKKSELEVFLSKDYITSYKIKHRLYNEGVKVSMCERCGVTDWLGKPLTMQLHHIDGDRFNNNLPNLQILCPNCHTQTDTYAKPLHKRNA